MEKTELPNQAEASEDINSANLFPLPKNGDCLFKEAPNWNDNLVVDPLGMADVIDPLGMTELDLRRIKLAGRWDLYARGYKRAADLLVEQLGPELVNDELLYPILYLYAHSLELKLKGLVIGSSKFSEKTFGIDDLSNNHDLYDLWGKLKENLPYVYRDCPSEWIKVVDKCLKEFSDLNERGQAFRYPLNTKKKQVLERLYCVDLVNFKKVMERISNFLSTAEEAVGQTREWHDELNSF